MKISMKDYQHNEYDSGEYISNRDNCCYEMMQPTVEANSYNSERIYIFPFIKLHKSHWSKDFFKENGI